MEHPVIIAGGGPSGAALAIELKRLAVPCLVAACPRPRLRFEGMSARTVELLERQGLTHARATLGQPGLRHAHWNGAESRHNSEFLVERARFDAALLLDLRDQGIPVVEADVRAVRRDGEGWEITAGEAILRAAFFVEARGRAAPAGVDTAFRGPATLAVSRLFGCAHGEDATSVMPFRDGWAWLGRSRDGICAVQFMISADDAPQHGQAGLTVLHERLLAELEPVRAWLPDGAQPLAPATARDCTAYLRDDLAGPRHIRIGDAACGLDPLSGQGVFLALAGALSAAAVVNSCVNRPEDACLAAEFHIGRTKRQFQEKLALSGQFYAQERSWPDSPFWMKRAGMAMEDHAVAGLHREARPVLDKGWVVRREVFVTPRHPLGVWRLDDVPVVDLADWLMVKDHPTAGALGDYAAHAGLPLANVARAAAWLRQAGILQS